MIGDRVPNTPPETEVTSTPPALDQTSFQVTFYWKGSDRDGEVVAFEWRISDNGADGVIDPADTLEVNLPWHRTTMADSTFFVSADLDSFELDVEQGGGDESDIRFWQTHTFFVRAVDDRGDHDPTPARVSFTATTIAPEVTIDFPVPTTSNACTSGPEVLTFGWEAVDPDLRLGDPTHVRYLFKPVPECLLRVEYERQAPIRGDDPDWSEWIPYDPDLDSTRRVTLPRQNLGTTLFFAVQARDVAGAVTPTFDWGRNLRHIEVGSSHFAKLFVSEDFLPERSFVQSANLISFDLAAGQTVAFRWEADASHYGGAVDAFRFGWNLTDPDNPNDPGWAVNWGNGPSWKRSPPRSFDQGTPNFVIACRDNSGNVTRVMYQFRVISLVPRQQQRPLLLVDDWPLENTQVTDELEARWDARWFDLLTSLLPGFLRADVIDATDEPERLSFETLKDYRAVIWSTSASTQSFFFNELAYEDSFRRNLNWLELYQKSAGNVMMVGPGVAYASYGPRRYRLLLPIFLNAPEGGELGFGIATSVLDGVRILGRERWPYTGWCLELTDLVRPGAQRIYGETYTKRRRSFECDGLQRAVPSPQLFDAYPSAAGAIVDLLPTEERTEQDTLYKLQSEEFYNFNASPRPLTLALRDCQVPMYLHRSRRSEGLVAEADEVCYPVGSSASTLDGAPIAVVSRIYSDGKPLVGSHDFLWGFHVHGFAFSGIRGGLSWILGQSWEIGVRN